MKRIQLLIIFFISIINAFAFPPTIVTVSFTQPLCIGQSDGTIVISATGTGAINYSIDNGTTFQSSNIFTGLPAGIYDVAVQDITGVSTQQIILNYQTSVTAAFIPSVTTGAAVLNVDFVNTSINTNNYNWNFDGSTSNSTLTNPSFAYDTPGSFLVTLIASNGNCKDTASATITVTGQSEILEIPNVFSPNNDGLNDVFMIPSIGIKTMEVFIYNRYGEIVYEWMGKLGHWDGHTYPAGQSVPEGTYYYHYSAIGYDGKTFDNKGIITLLR